MFMFQDSIFLQGYLPSDVDKIIVNGHVSSNWILIIQIHGISMRAMISSPKTFSTFWADIPAQNNHSLQIHDVKIKFYASWNVDSLVTKLVMVLLFDLGQDKPKYRVLEPQSSLTCIFDVQMFCAVT
jgi:hypothetical protein